MSNLGKLILENIDLKNGTIIYNDLKININLPLEQQESLLDEDLLQISFDPLFVVDIGWYSHIGHGGCFLVMAIKNYDWHRPVFRKQSRNINTLKQHIQKAVNFVSCHTGSKYQRTIYFKNKRRN